MVYVDTVKLDGQLQEYKRNIDKYEDTIKNIFFETSKVINSMWDNDKTNVVFDKLYQMNIDALKLINDLIKFKSIYDYICSEYSKIGNKLNINLKSKGAIDKKFDEIISKISSIIKKYDKISELSDENKEQVNTQKEKLENISSNYTKLNTEISDNYSKVNEIENNVANLINNLNIINIVKDESGESK